MYHAYHCTITVRTNALESSADALMHRDRSQALRKIMVWILQPLISGQSALIKCVIRDGVNVRAELSAVSAEDLSRL